MWIVNKCKNKDYLHYVKVFYFYNGVLWLYHLLKTSFTILGKKMSHLHFRFSLHNGGQAASASAYDLLYLPNLTTVWSTVLVQIFYESSFFTAAEIFTECTVLSLQPSLTFKCYIFIIQYILAWQVTWQKTQPTSTCAPTCCVIHTDGTVYQQAKEIQYMAEFEWMFFTNNHVFQHVLFHFILQMSFMDDWHGCWWQHVRCFLTTSLFQTPGQMYSIWLESHLMCV